MTATVRNTLLPEIPGGTSIIVTLVVMLVLVVSWLGGR